MKKIPNGNLATVKSTRLFEDMEDTPIKKGIVYPKEAVTCPFDAIRRYKDAIGFGKTSPLVNRDISKTRKCAQMV